MIKKLIFTIVIVSIYLTTQLHANDFENWKSSLITQAINAGISEETANKNIKAIKKVNKKVLNLYNNQPEFKITLKDYMRRNISEKRINKGKNYLKKFEDILSIIDKTYNIPPQIIVSIWALESSYGYYTGSFNIIDSLTTLSYQSKRKTFFKKELFSALKILDKKLIEKNSLKGSWAGAMGQSQFMPSSYLRYAVDYNNDNKIDIWSTEADVFASIANYLNKHGWNKNEPWSMELANNKKHDVNIKKKYNLAQLNNLNIFNVENKMFLENSVGKIKVIKNNQEEKIFFVFENFYIIKKYNNSDFYALTVGKLANKISSN